MPLDGTRNAMTAILQRRAVRSYTAEQVDAATVRELLHAAVQAPTAMHLEPWGFVVIQDRARLHRYSDRAREILVERSRTIDPATPAAEASERRHLAMLADPAVDLFHGAGTLVVICRRTGGSFADADCWLAAENLMLAATDLGLGTCVIGLAVPLLNAEDVKRELGIPEAGAAVAPIIVGVPRATPAPVPRKAPVILAWIA